MWRTGSRSWCADRPFVRPARLALARPVLLPLVVQMPCDVGHSAARTGVERGHPRFPSGRKEIVSRAPRLRHGKLGRRHRVRGSSATSGAGAQRTYRGPLIRGLSHIEAPASEGVETGAGTCWAESRRWPWPPGSLVARPDARPRRRAHAAASWPPWLSRHASRSNPGRTPLRFRPASDA